jgi:hypothetical protein
MLQPIGEGSSLRATTSQVGRGGFVHEPRNFPSSKPRGALPRTRLHGCSYAVTTTPATLAAELSVPCLEEGGHVGPAMQRTRTRRTDVSGSCRPSVWVLILCRSSINFEDLWVMRWICASEYYSNKNGAVIEPSHVIDQHDYGNGLGLWILLVAKGTYL